MNLQPVTSSIIQAIGHEGTTLAVRFKTGAVWHYQNVPDETFQAMLDSDSVGSFFNSRIRGKHIATKVEDATPPPADPAPGEPTDPHPLAHIPGIRES